MTDQEKHLRQSANLMRILGWLLVVGRFVESDNVTFTDPTFVTVGYTWSF